MVASVCRLCQAIAVDPFDSNHLYLSAQGIYISTDSGQSWTQTNSASATAFSTDANIPGLVYALAGGVYRSADAGATWTLVWSNPYPFQMPSFAFAVATSVLADPVHAGQAYIFGYTSCNMGCPPAYWVLQSTDQGATWNAAPVLGQSGSFDPTTGDLYLVGGGKLSVIRGGDLSNAPVALNLPAVNSLVFDPDVRARLRRAYRLFGDFERRPRSDLDAGCAIELGPARCGWRERSAAC